MVLNTNTDFIFNCNLLAFYTFYAVPSSGKDKYALENWVDKTVFPVVQETRSISNVKIYEIGLLQWQKFR